MSKYATDEAFENLLRFIRDYLSVVDEVAFFESITHHLYLPLEVIRQRAELLARRIPALKQAGVASVGINVLTTMGHVNEAWAFVLSLPFQPMVGHDGALSKSCACPNTPKFREYVREKYRLMAEARPDFIWVDDDIRMHHHGVAFGCFCSTCLDLFSRVTGRAWTRESLVRALNDPSEGSLRQAWVEQNCQSIEKLLAEIRMTVHAVNPQIATGLMTTGPGWTTYSGPDFTRWFSALGATKARPGGGFYSDAHRYDLVSKAFEVGRQRVELPDDVADCQYEVENFPYQALTKSVGSMMNECTLALAQGLNGMAFNALGLWETDLQPFEEIARRAHEYRPVWEQLLRHAHGLPTAGLWIAWTPWLMARRAVQPGENWFSFEGGYNYMRTRVLAEIGLPLCVDRPGSATVLHGRVAETFDENELRTMLSGGVIMDTEALDVLVQRGLDKLVGVRRVRQYDNGVVERFSSDSLNAGMEGQLRDARIEFWGNARGMADVLEATVPGVRVLAVLEDYFHRPLGPCLTAYENELGGRAVVMGYAPWIFLHSAIKRKQLQNVADWVTFGWLPVRILEPVSLIPFVAMAPDRSRAAIVFLNSGLDPIERATIEVRMPVAPVRLVRPSGEVTLDVAPANGAFRIKISDLAAWTTAVVLVG